MQAALKSQQSHPYCIMLQTVMKKEIFLPLECIRIILVEMV